MTRCLRWQRDRACLQMFVITTLRRMSPAMSPAAETQGHVTAREAHVGIVVRVHAGHARLV